MKHHILLGFVLGIATSVSGQDIGQDQVPAEVMNAFRTQFPDAKAVEWEREGDLLKADFEIGNRDHDVWIDATGKIEKHQQEISKNELTDGIRRKIKSDFSDYKIDDVEKIEENEKVYFRVDLDSRSGDREVLFSEDGTVQEGVN